MTPRNTQLWSEGLSCGLLIGMILGMLVLANWQKLRAAWRDATRDLP